MREFKWAPITEGFPDKNSIILLRNREGQFDKFRYHGDDEWEQCSIGKLATRRELNQITHWSYVPEVIDYEWHRVEDLPAPEFEDLNLYVQDHSSFCMGRRHGFSGWVIHGISESPTIFKVSHWRRLQKPEN